MFQDCECNIMMTTVFIFTSHKFKLIVNVMSMDNGYNGYNTLCKHESSVFLAAKPNQI